MWMLEFREQFLHLLKWPKVLCVIFLNQNFSLHALVRVSPQVLFFSATHGLELFDSSVLNRYDIFSLCNCEKFFVVQKCKIIFHCQFGTDKFKLFMMQLLLLSCCCFLGLYQIICFFFLSQKAQVLDSCCFFCFFSGKLPETRQLLQRQQCHYSV